MQCELMVLQPVSLLHWDSRDAALGALCNPVCFCAHGCWLKASRWNDWQVIFRACCLSASSFAADLQVKKNYACRIIDPLLQE